MKKTLKFLLPLTILAVGVAQAQTTYYSTGNGDMNDTTTWNTARDGSGTAPVAMPTITGDTDLWVIEETDTIQAGPDNEIFYGGTMVIEGTPFGADGELFNNRDQNVGVQALTLDGGALYVFREGNGSIYGTTLTVNEGQLGARRDIARYRFDTITGSGDLYILARNNGAVDGDGTVPQNGGPVRMGAGGAVASTTDWSGYTGTIKIVASASSGFFGFEENVTGTFNLVVLATGNYRLENDVEVGAAQVGGVWLTPGGGTGTDGVYIYDDFVTAGTDGSIVDDGGTLKVTAAGTVTAPTVSQDPAGSIFATGATITGTATDTGGELPTYTVFYSTTDEGTNEANWLTSGASVSAPAGTDFSADITGLTEGVTYFYNTKVTNTAGSSWAISSGPSDSFVPTAIPATVDTVQNGGLTVSSTWVGSPAVPTSGTSDTSTWRILHNVIRDATDPGTGDISFAGQSLEIGDGASNDGELSLRNDGSTLTVRNLTLNSNGEIDADGQTNGNQIVTGDTMTFSGDGGLIDSGRPQVNGRINLDFENYAGDGTAYFWGNNASRTMVEFRTTNATPGTAMQGFTGTLWNDKLNGSGGYIAWAFSVTEATFNLVLSDAPSLPPGGQGPSDTAGQHGKMFLTSGVDVKVKSLRLYDVMADGTTVVTDVLLPNGTYTYADLANVGGQDYQAFFVDDDGTGTVTVDDGSGGGSNNYSDWIAMFPGVGAETGFNDNPDGDNNDNGLESFFGSDPNVADSAGLSAGTKSGSTFTFIHPQNATPPDDITATYMWSTDLVNFYPDGPGSGADAGTTVNFSAVTDTPAPGTTTVTASVTGPDLDALFVDVSVTLNP